jgi:hypothetical protein
LEALELAIRTAMMRLGGSLLGRVLAADTGHRGPHIDCGAGHSAEFVGYWAKTIQTVLGPVTLRRAYYHCAACGCGSCRATKSSVSPGGIPVTGAAQDDCARRCGLRHRVARFGVLCGSCPLRADCTKSRRGRVISIHPHEAALQHAKARQRDPDWQQDYRTYRPVVERKISHFTRRPWGARNAWCRGHKRILTDILARAGAINLARLATLGLHHGPTGWAIA